VFQAIDRLLLVSAWSKPTKRERETFGKELQSVQEATPAVEGEAPPEPVTGADRGFWSPVNAVPSQVSFLRNDRSLGSP